jgi:23S rRNA (guanosine2251-2'-O)-methyltransferase
VTEWIGGRRPVAEALAAGRPAHRLLIARSAKPSPELKALRTAAARAAVPVEEIGREELGRLAGFDGHQGVLLEVELRRWSDPVNLGAVLRTAEAAGIDGVVFPERRSAPLSPAAVKSSAGASEHLRLAPVESLGATLAELQARGIRLVAADQDAPALAWDADLRGPIAVVVGGEGAGLTTATRRRCDLLVRFPMAGRVASLNAAAAGALLLFEVVRQRAEASA